MCKFMAFKRKAKPTRKSRRGRKNKKTTIKKVVNQILKKNVELKSIITAVTESTVNTLSSPDTSNSILLNNVSLGTFNYNRIGLKIRGKFVDIRGSIQGTTSPCVVKLIVLQTSSRGDTPTDDLFESNAATFGLADVDLAGIYSRLNTTKYKILATKQIMAGNSAGWISAKLFRMKIPLKNTLYAWDQGQTLPERKLIFLYYARRLDNDESTGLNVEITWNSKFYYYDM